MPNKNRANTPGTSTLTSHMRSTNMRSGMTSEMQEADLGQNRVTKTQQGQRPKFIKVNKDLFTGSNNLKKPQFDIDAVAVDLSGSESKHSII